MSWGQTELVGGERCRTCNRESAARDNFCRWCGAQQGDDPVAAAGAEWLAQKTTVLTQNEGTPRSLSSLPLNALTQAVAMKTGSLRLNRVAALAVAVLVAIPMWLLIILLSPFDAYLSARTAWSQMDIR